MLFHLSLEIKWYFLKSYIFFICLIMNFDYYYNWLQHTYTLSIIIARKPKFWGDYSSFLIFVEFWSHVLLKLLRWNSKKYVCIWNRLCSKVSKEQIYMSLIYIILYVFLSCIFTFIYFSKTLYLFIIYIVGIWK